MPIKPIARRRDFTKSTKYHVVKTEKLNLILDSFEEEIPPKKSIWDTSYNKDSFKFGPNMIPDFSQVSKDFGPKMTDGFKNVVKGFEKKKEE